METTTIKIVRIGGEFMNEAGQVSRYINPYTGNPFDTWYLYEEGKKIFDSLTFDSLLKEEEDILEEYKLTEEQLKDSVAFEVINGYKPYLYLFGYEISKVVWDNKESLAVIHGYDEGEEMRYITELTDYEWSHEETKEISVKLGIQQFKLK
jgi:hypothetical protein